MSAVVVTAGALFGARFPLTEDASVGRLSSSTVQLPSTQISRQHARIFRKGRGFWVEDLGSRNGTRVNDQPVTGRTRLESGDVIRFGEIPLIFDPPGCLAAARYGEAWVIFANPELDVEPYQSPVGRFSASSGDLAGLSHLMAATLEEEGLVRGILQLVQDRISAEEVVLVRLGAGLMRFIPLGVVAPSGPVPVHLGLVERVVAQGRPASLSDVPRTLLSDGALEQRPRGGPALCAPLRLEGGVAAFLYVTRGAGGEAFTPDEVARVGALVSLFGPALDNARRAQLQRRRHRAWVEPEKSEGLLSGDSDLARGLRASMQGAATSGAPLLLVGLAGTGKERIARLIHARSERWEGPLVQVRCAQLSDSQLELNLFGRVGRSQRDATAQRLERAVVGKAALADGGTLYLDRVDTLSAAVQDRLLRLLQSGYVWRLRDTRARRVDVRVIASSELSLEELASGGVLRADLLALLAANVVEVPTLAERMKDLEALVEELVARVSVRLGRSIRQITDEAFDVLRGRAWPGNLRELEGVLTRAVSFSDDEVLTGEDVVLGGDAAAASTMGGGRLSDALRDSERELLLRALHLAQGNLAEAARSLGMEQGAFWRRMRQLGLERP